MRVIDLQQINKRRFQLAKKRRRTRRSFVALVLVVFVAGYSYLAYQRPLPDAAAVKKPLSVSVPAKPALSWPSYGQSAVGTKEYGVLDTNGDQVPSPTASVAKVMTALAVLRQKPLQPGQQGPVITLDADDLSFYHYYASNGGSVVFVTEGEQITQYQALQAMLLPSANNMADSLVKWAFGSMDNYKAYANNLATQLGMAKTHVADASGFSAETASTASDLVKLGIAAMDNPVLTEIVAQPEAEVPVAGVVSNTNRQLGSNEVVGIKTGNTDEAGGCYLFASSHTFSNGKKITTIGAIMAAPSLGTAINDSAALLSSTYSGFGSVVVAAKQQEVGNYKFAWGATNQAHTSEDLAVFTWLGKTLEPSLTLESLPFNSQVGAPVGTISVNSKLEKKSQAIVVSRAIIQLTWQWRLTHPF